MIQIKMCKPQRLHRNLTLFTTLVYNLSIDPASETDTKHPKSKIEHLKKKACKVGISGTLIAFHLNFWLSCT